ATLFPQHWTVEQHFAARELVETNFIGGFSTCVYRRQVVAALKPELWDLDIREWPFNIIMAEHGSIGYVPPILSVYRAHEGGIWSLRSNNEQFDELCHLIESYDKFLDYKFSDEFQKMKAAARNASTTSGVPAYLRTRIGFARCRRRIWISYWR